MPVVDAAVVGDWVSPDAGPELPAQRLRRQWGDARDPYDDMLYAALAERLGTTLVTANELLRGRLSNLTWLRPPGEGAVSAAPADPR